MALREFTAVNGRLWRVWDTNPEKPQLVRPGYENGWLVFETDDGEKCRLAPFPADWVLVEDAALADLLQAARGANAAQAPIATA